MREQSVAHEEGQLGEGLPVASLGPDHQLPLHSRASSRPSQ